MPLLFIAGGTGLAPVLALLEQQVQLFPERDMVLLWGMRNVTDFYAADTLQALAARAPQLRIVLVAEALPKDSPESEHLRFIKGDVLDAIGKYGLLNGQRDIYAAGPSAMLRVLARELDERKVGKDRVHMDSFGV